MQAKVVPYTVIVTGQEEEYAAERVSEHQPLLIKHIETTSPCDISHA